jgi:cytochrome b561
MPPILPHNAMLYAILRKTHTIVAYLFFLTFVAHFSAVLFHTLILARPPVGQNGALESPLS